MIFGVNRIVSEESEDYLHRFKESRPGQAAGFDDARFVNLLPQVSCQWKHRNGKPTWRSMGT